MLLTSDFYCAHDVVKIARNLIGKVIFTHDANGYTSGIITETEAYAGAVDRASHAYGNRRTQRTEVMYAKGGRAYVYLCYGVHHLFNVVSNREGIPHAVLLRGIFPLDGKDIMEMRRGKKLTSKGFTDGPGKVSQALGITVQLNGDLLDGSRIGIEDRGMVIPLQFIMAGPRIGVDYAGDDALLPYRFVTDPNKWAQKNLPI